MFQTRNISIVLVSLLLSFSAATQEDTTLVLPEMSVSIQKISVVKIRNERSLLLEEEIRLLATNDIGELLSKLSGVNLKSYGGLGGLKTVSVRALGASHNSTVIDGFAQSNSQTGQVNLGRIQSDNIIGAVVSAGDVYGFLLPVSTQINGSSVVLQTFENAFESDTLKIRAKVNYGSFDQMNGYLGAKYTGKKFFVSGFGKYRVADGDYHYRYLNGNTWNDGVRKNNDYQDQYYGGTVGLSLKNSRSRFGYNGSSSNQGLPGAVIFYNETADERLENTKHKVFADHSHYFTNTYVRFFADYNKDNLEYRDPTFLNSAGGINDQYTNDMVTGGVSFYHRIENGLNLQVGLEQQYSQLKSNDTSFSSPIRNRSIALVGVNREFSFGNIGLHVSGQYVNEQNRTNASARNRLRVNPFLKFKSKRGKRASYHQVWYRNSFRMPSFNELYYNNVGNNELLPETAHQLNYGYQFVPIDKKNFEWFIRSNTYFNIVENKILAIPTKNMFVWSMQNVTNVHIYGAEAYFDLTWSLKQSSIMISGSYTFQKVLDMTKESLNYGDQLAYSPEHLVNFDLNYNAKNWGVQLSNSFTSSRYSLNENIDFNKLEGFFLMNLGAYYAFKFSKKNELRIQVNIKNLLNENYAYVRSYVMPGRNYLISLSYAFN